MRAKKEKLYLFNFANTVIEQLQIGPIRPVGGSQNQSQRIYGTYSCKIKQMLVGMPNARGKIAEFGRSDSCEAGLVSLQHVHGSDTAWLNGELSGRDLIIEIACAAIIAEITEILWWRYVNGEKPSFKDWVGRSATSTINDEPGPLFWG